MGGAETWEVGAEAGGATQSPTRLHVGQLLTECRPGPGLRDFTATDFTVLPVRGAGFSSE